MSSAKFSNRLIHETSPYLLQHAHNPVEWYAWSDEALQRARDEDKPILVSIGYSTCHWCHVMEKESFEDEATAEIMNRYFINIKIDREERPDLDHIYMDAVQAMTGSGGWPLNVFLTPDGKPFYGGTYFPPVKAFNRGSWKDTLHAVHDAYSKRKEEILSQAEKLTAHMIKANSFGLNKDESRQISSFSEQDLDTIAQNILHAADTRWGGFGTAPKFPQTFAIQFLLRHFHFTNYEPALQQALLSLDKMMQGGIYDHLGGGFARYSTDEKWLAPHFEKMLYDNALLISVFSEAYQLTGNESYAVLIKETLGFIKEELTSPERGFYSALDADSEGIEGKYYVWSKNEIDEILGNDAELFCTIYNVSEQGNWEHTNILWLQDTLESWSEKLGSSKSELTQKLNNCKKKLLEHRKKRIKPGLDDKVLLGWNALVATGCCKAFAATGVNEYLEMAEQNISFIENSLRSSTGSWYHTWKAGTGKYPAFLDDYACLIQAYISLQEVSGRSEYLLSAKNLTEEVINEFSDDDSSFFWFTNISQENIVVRKKEIYDGAVPSGNALMAENLLYLSIVFDFPDWKMRAYKMLESLSEVVMRYPSSFGLWALLMQKIISGINEIAVVGSVARELASEINKLFIPNKVIQFTSEPRGNFPLLREKYTDGNGSLIYLCKDYACKQPADSVEEFISLLKK